MTPARRIILNIAATYGRSLYALAVGLFCGRWALMALGETDYGLMGVVGGLTVFITYLNAVLSGALGRFYALAVGEQKTDPVRGMDHCRMWFTTAVVIQTVMPTLLLVCCYPAGEWAVRHFLEIPPDRLDSCVWVWRFVCVSCYLGMLAMPWNAMYVAHQYIAELTIYSFATTTLNFLFLYYMVTHPGVWLAKYAFWQCLLSILPNIIIWARAHCIFPECRIVRRHLACWNNVRKMASYALWNAWGGLGAVLKGQGLAILVNKYFGPRANAGVAVGTSLSSHCDTLAGSMIGAFSPAIFNAWGAGEREKARKLAFRTCKIGTLLILLFSLPLSLEVDEVLFLWLKNPPRYAAGICLFVMAMTVLDKMAVGHMICVNANGKIAKYQAFVGTSLVLTLPVAWLLIELGGGVYSIGWAMVGTMAVCALGRVFFARHLAGMSATYWVRRIFLPLAMLILLCLGIGSLPKLFLGPSVLRLGITTLAVETLLLPLSWMLVLDGEEREFAKSRLASAMARLKGRE
jgi:O-antigen/teichoic acid export membrane protein